MQTAIAHATNRSQHFIHFYVKTTAVSCTAQSSCPLQGEYPGPLELAFTTSMQVRHSIYTLATEA